MKQKKLLSFLGIIACLLLSMPVVGETENDLTSVTFSPEGCSFVDKMEVEIASVRKEAKIYFTLDGTTPTTKSTVYVKPITINTSVTVKAIAVLGNSTSEVASASYVKISDYVDLGLPSGNLWASCNMGATKPEDRGTSFCWGDNTFTGSDSYANYKWRVGGGEFLKRLFQV